MVTIWGGLLSRYSELSSLLIALIVKANRHYKSTRFRMNTER